MKTELTIWIFISEIIYKEVSFRKAFFFFKCWILESEGMTSAKICNIGCEIRALTTKADKQERNGSSRGKQLKKAKEII